MYKRQVLSRKVFEEAEKQKFKCVSTDYDAAKEEYDTFILETYEGSYDNKYVRRYFNSFLGEEFFTKRYKICEKWDPYKFYNEMLDCKEKCV